MNLGQTIDPAWVWARMPSRSSPPAATPEPAPAERVPQPAAVDREDLGTHSTQRVRLCAAVRDLQARDGRGPNVVSMARAMKCTNALASMSLYNAFRGGYLTRYGPRGKMRYELSDLGLRYLSEYGDA